MALSLALSLSLVLASLSFELFAIDDGWNSRISYLQIGHLTFVWNHILIASLSNICPHTSCNTISLLENGSCVIGHELLIGDEILSNIISLDERLICSCDGNTFTGVKNEFNCSIGKIGIWREYECLSLILLRWL